MGGLLIMARKRYSLAITGGMLNAASNAIKDSVLDPRGGGLDTFSVELQRVGGGGTPWWGASWVMEETGMDTISFEALVTDVVQGLSMNHNTGDANVQFVSMSEDDFAPGTSPLGQFLLMLADTSLKPWALERVPQIP